MFAALSGLDTQDLAATQRAYDRKCRQRQYAAQKRREEQDADRARVDAQLARAAKKQLAIQPAQRTAPRPAPPPPPPPTSPTSRSTTDVQRRPVPKEIRQAERQAERRERPPYDPSQTPCRYGPDCKAEWCHFGHPWRYRHAPAPTPAPKPAPKSAPEPPLCPPCAPPADDRPSVDDDRLCVICLVEERQYALLPCGHRCVCKGCFEGVLTTPTPKCPLCNTVLQHAKGVRVFG
jgi:hypothetical protein